MTVVTADDHDHLWQAMRSRPPSWRCYYCGDRTDVKPCACPRCCQEPPGRCQQPRQPFQAFTPDPSASAASPSDCPTCEGGGLMYGEEPPGWWHGSGVNIPEHPCHDCGGTGEQTASPLCSCGARAVEDGGTEGRCECCTDCERGEPLTDEARLRLLTPPEVTP